MAGMRYFGLILEKFKELHKENPELTFAEMLYSVLRKPSLWENPQEGNVAWLLDLKDDNIYASLERVINDEIVYKSEQNEVNKQ